MRKFQAPSQLEKAAPVLPGDGRHADTKVFNEKDYGDIHNDDDDDDNYDIDDEDDTVYQ